LRPGAAVLDPCCGSGTILIEAALLEPRLRVLGGDMDADRLADARRNGALAGVSLPLVVADVMDPAVHRGRIDRVVVNPPWGTQVLPRGGMAKPVPIWVAVEQLLASDGRSVVLSPGTPAETMHQSGLVPSLVLPVSLAGSRVSV